MENKFNDIIDELNWEMVKMSNGNAEAVQTFVQERNRIRENEQKLKKENSTKEKI